jgi:hypothetical protein
MKVKIGPYTSYLGPYQIIDAVFFWQEKYPSDELMQRWDYKLHDRLSDWLASTWVSDFCQWIYNKRGRTIKVNLDKYDTWSMDHTLAIIICPMLKQLQATKHGAPKVDDKDVPKELRSTEAAPKENDWVTDDLWYDRWDWVLTEMIWTFEQLSDEAESDSKFFDHSEVDNSSDINTQVKQLKVDRKGLKQHWDRIDNGLRLFGKYYRNLWD